MQEFEEWLFHQADIAKEQLEEWEKKYIQGDPLHESILSYKRAHLYTLTSVLANYFILKGKNK